MAEKVPPDTVPEHQLPDEQTRVDEIPESEDTSRGTAVAEESHSEADGSTEATAEPTETKLDTDDKDSTGSVDSAEPATTLSPVVPQGENSAPSLEVIRGSDQGTIFDLGAGEISIGRDSENQVVVSDLTVSRRHFLIDVAGGQCVLRDLGSGNGTLVNGRPVESRPLEEGDRIEVGRTVFRFSLSTPEEATGEGPALSAEGPVAPPGDKGKPTRTLIRAGAAARSEPSWTEGTVGWIRTHRLAAGATAGSVVLALLVVALLLSRPVADADALTAHGIVAFQDGAYETAALDFELALEGRPGDERLRGLLEQSRVEARAQKAIDLALAAAVSDDSARTEIMLRDQVPRNSKLASRVTGILAALNHRLAAKHVAHALERKMAGDPSRALAGVGMALTLVPDHPAAIALSRELQDSPKATPPPVQSSPPPTKTRSRKHAKNDPYGLPTTSQATRKSSRHADKPSRPDEADRLTDSSLSAARAHYRNRSFAEAAEDLESRATKARSSDAGKLQRMAGQVREIGTLIKQVEQGMQSKPSSAVRAAERAILVDRKLPISNGYLSDYLGSKLAKSAKYWAMESYQRKRFTDAFSAAQKAFSLGVPKSELSTVTTGLEREAKKRFDRAQQYRNTQPTTAANLLDGILRIVPSDSDWYRAAARARSALGRAGSIDEDE